MWLYKHLLLGVFILSTFNLFSQLELFYLSELPFFVSEMAIHENRLYFGFKDEDQDKFILAVSDLEQSSGFYSTLIELDHVVSSIAFKDDFLYFSSSTLGAIFKIDLNSNKLEPEKIIEGLSKPSSIVIINNSIFVQVVVGGVIVDNGISGIVNLDLNSNSNQGEIIADSIGLLSMDKHKGDLIFSDGREDCIYRYDGTAITLVDCIDGPINDIAIRNDELYATETSTTQYSRGSINRLDLSNNQSGVVNVTEDVISPIRLAVSDEHLYIFGSYIIGFISKLTLDEPLSNVSVLSKKEITVYPNPTSNLLNIDGDNYNFYEIYSLDGESKLDSRKLINGEIDVSKLPAGYYFLFLDRKHVVKFQKIN